MSCTMQGNDSSYFALSINSKNHGQTSGNWWQLDEKREEKVHIAI